MSRHKYYFIQFYSLKNDHKLFTIEIKTQFFESMEANINVMKVINDYSIWLYAFFYIKSDIPYTTWFTGHENIKLEEI